MNPDKVSAENKKYVTDLSWGLWGLRKVIVVLNLILDNFELQTKTSWGVFILIY